MQGKYNSLHTKPWRYGEQGTKRAPGVQEIDYDKSKRAKQWTDQVMIFHKRKTNIWKDVNFKLLNRLGLRSQHFNHYAQGCGLWKKSNPGKSKIVILQLFSKLSSDWLLLGATQKGERVKSNMDTSWGVLYQHGLLEIQSWISNFMYKKLWSIITHPCLNFNSTVKSLI